LATFCGPPFFFSGAAADFFPAFLEGAYSDTFSEFSEYFFGADHGAVTRRWRQAVKVKPSTSG
jgi:hypothetical protein